MSLIFVFEEKFGMGNSIGRTRIFQWRFWKRIVEKHLFDQSLLLSPLLMKRRRSLPQTGRSEVISTPSFLSPMKRQSGMMVKYLNTLFLSCFWFLREESLCYAFKP